MAKGEPRRRPNLGGLPRPRCTIVIVNLFVSELYVDGHGPLKSCVVPMGAVTVLVGVNGTGKTTIVELLANRLKADSAQGEARVTFSESKHALGFHRGKALWFAKMDEPGDPPSLEEAVDYLNNTLLIDLTAPVTGLGKIMADARLYANFGNVVSILDNLRDVNEGAYRMVSEIASKLTKGEVMEVGLRTVEDHQKQIRLSLQGGPSISFPQLSHGMQIMVKIAVLLGATPSTSILCIEEIERGLHPSAIKEVVGMLKNLVSEGVVRQLVMTTHSPFVWQEFAEDEIVVLDRFNADSEISAIRVADLEDHQSIWVDESLASVQGLYKTLGDLKEKA